MELTFPQVYANKSDKVFSKNPMQELGVRKKTQKVIPKKRFQSLTPPKAVESSFGYDDMFRNEDDFVGNRYGIRPLSRSVASSSGFKTQLQRKIEDHNFNYEKFQRSLDQPFDKDKTLFIFINTHGGTIMEDDTNYILETFELPVNLWKITNAARNGFSVLNDEFPKISQTRTKADITPNTLGYDIANFLFDQNHFAKLYSEQSGIPSTIDGVNNKLQIDHIGNEVTAQMMTLEDTAFRIFSRKGCLGVEKVLAVDLVKERFSQTCVNLINDTTMPSYNSFSNGIYLCRKDGLQNLDSNHLMNLNACPEFILFCKGFKWSKINTNADGEEYVYRCCLSCVLSFVSQQMNMNLDDVFVVDTSCEVSSHTLSDVLSKTKYLHHLLNYGKFKSKPLEVLKELTDYDAADQEHSRIHQDLTILDIERILAGTDAKRLRASIIKYFGIMNIEKVKYFNDIRFALLIALTPPVLKSYPLLMDVLTTYIPKCLDYQLGLLMSLYPEIASLSRASLGLMSDDKRVEVHNEDGVSYFLPGWKKINFTKADLERLRRTDKNPFNVQAVVSTRSILPLRGGGNTKRKGRKGRKRLCRRRLTKRHR